MSGEWFDDVELAVEISFTTGPASDSPVWEDVSDWVRSIRTFRGATDETGEFGPGTCDLILSNEEREFDPDNADGPWYPNVKPMRRLRVTATRSAASFVLFDGFIRGWPQQWGKSANSDGTVAVTAVEQTRLNQNALLADDAYAAEILKDSPDHYWPLQSVDQYVDEIGGVDLSLSGDKFNVPRLLDVGAPIGAAFALGGARAQTYVDLDELPEAASAWMTFTDGYAEHFFYSTEVVLVAGSSPNERISFGEDSGELRVGFWRPDTSQYHPWSTSTGIPVPHGTHHVAVWADETDIHLMVDGHVRYTAALTAGTQTDLVYPVYVQAFALFDDLTLTSEQPGVSHVAAWTTAPSEARLQQHYLAGLTAWGHPFAERSGERIERILDEIGVPNDRRDISTGTVIQGPYLPAGRPAADMLDDVARSEQGLLFIDREGRVAFRDRQWMWTSRLELDNDGAPELDGNDDPILVDLPTFSDDGDSSAVVMMSVRPDGNSIETMANIVTCSYAQTGAITRRDQTSIDDVGEARLSLSTPTLPSGRAASGLAAYLLRLGVTPRTRIPELEVAMRPRTAVHFPILCALDIGDPVQVEVTPMSVGSQSVRRAMVFGIGHEIGPDQWTTSLYLSPVVPDAVDVPYLTVSGGTLGEIGDTAGNLIPF